METHKNYTSLIIEMVNILNTIIKRLSILNKQNNNNIFNQTKITNTSYTNNITNNTILNNSTFNISEKSIINPPISDNLINSTFNHIETTETIETTSLQNYSFINNGNIYNITNMSDIVYSNETHILNSIFDSENNKVNNNTKKNLINNGNFTDDIMVNNKNNTTKEDLIKTDDIILNSNNNTNYQSNVINTIKTNSYDRITLILGIFFALIIFLFIIYLIYCCFKRKKKLNSLDHNDLNKIKLKTSRAKVSYKKMQNTSNINLIIPDNLSMSKIKAQNIQNESLMSKNSGSSTSRRLRENNDIDKNNNFMMSGEGQKEVRNEKKTN